MTIHSHIAAANSLFNRGGTCYYARCPEGQTLDAFHRALRAKAQGKGWRFWKQADVATIRIKPKRKK